MIFGCSGPRIAPWTEARSCRCVPWRSVAGSSRKTPTMSPPGRVSFAPGSVPSWRRGCQADPFRGAVMSMGEFRLVMRRSWTKRLARRNSGRPIAPAERGHGSAGKGWRAGRVAQGRRRILRAFMIEGLDAMACLPS